MQTVIDYCGFRVIAQVAIPTRGPSSLPLTGAAASRVKVPPSSEFHVEKVAKAVKDSLASLNLASLPNEASVYRGGDGKYYVDGLHSLFPRLDEKRYPGMTIRPEYVCQEFRGCPCSDSATLRLARTWPHAIPLEPAVDIVSKLVNTTSPSYVASRVASDDFAELFQKEFDNINDLHRYGINFRLMGLVRAEMHRALKSANNDGLFLAEMLARALKNQFKTASTTAISKLTFFSEEPAKAEFVRLVNLVLQPALSEQFWRVTVKGAISSWFGTEALHVHERESSYSLLDSLSGAMRFYLVWRLAALVGFELPSAVIHDVRVALTTTTSAQLTLADLSFRSPLRIKAPAVLDFAVGVLSIQTALSSIESNVSPATSVPRLLADAKVRLLAGYDSASFARGIELWVAKYYLSMSLVSCVGGSSESLSRAASILASYRARNPVDLDAARYQAVTELLLVIAGSEKDMRHMSDHVRCAKDCMKLLAAASSAPKAPAGLLSVEDEILLWLGRIIKVRPDKADKQLLDRFKAQAHATLQLALPETQFVPFSKKLAQLSF